MEMRTELRELVSDTALGCVINREGNCVMQKERDHSEAGSNQHGMKFSTTGFGVIYLGTNKVSIYSVGAHHSETAVEKTLGIFTGSTEAVCNLYDASKKQKDKCDFNR